MISFLILFFLLVFSIFLYVFSEYGVNYSIIDIDCVLFLIGSYITLRKDFARREYVSFNSLFFFSFFLVTFFFPLFVYNTPIDLRLWTGKFIDYNYMTLGVSLSTMCICFYFISFNWICRFSLTRSKELTLSNIVIEKNIEKYTRYFFYVISFVLLINIIYIFKYVGVESITLDTNPFLNQLFIMLLTYSLAMNNLGFNNNFNRKFNIIVLHNKSLLIPAIIIALLFLYVGDRGLPISITITILAIYAFCYKKLKFRHLLTLGIIGVFLLFAIQIARMPSNGALRDGDFLKILNDVTDRLGENSLLLVFSDLYGITNELCLGYEYHQKVGQYLPDYVFIIPFLMFPYLPTFFSKIFWGKTFFDLSTGVELNNYMSSAAEAHFGTNIVIDLFMRWNVWGAVFFFCFFGIIIGLFSTYKYKNIYAFSVFICLISQAIYLPRSSFFDIVRTISLFYIWLLLCKHLNNYKLRRGPIQCER